MTNCAISLRLESADAKSRAHTTPRRRVKRSGTPSQLDADSTWRLSPSECQRAGTGSKPVEKLQAIDEELQVVICGGFSDVEWQKYCPSVGHNANVFLLRTPLNKLDVWQLATILIDKQIRLQITNSSKLIQSILSNSSTTTFATRKMRRLARAKSILLLPLLVASNPHPWLSDKSSIGWCDRLRGNVNIGWQLKSD